MTDKDKAAMAALRAALDAKLGPDPRKCDNLPRTKAFNPSWWGGKPLGQILREAIPKFGDALSPALPKQPSYMFARLGTPIERPDRGKIMAVAEAFNAETRDLKQSGLAVLRALLFRFWNHYTGQCNPSYDTIASAAGVGRRTVARAIKRLKAAGLLHWLASFAAGRRSSNRYRIGTGCQKGTESPPVSLLNVVGERKLQACAMIDALMRAATSAKVDLLLLQRYRIVQT